MCRTFSGTRLSTRRTRPKGGHPERLSLILPLLLLAVTTRADKVDDYLRAEMAKRYIPGLSLAVVNAGKVVRAVGYGLANVEHNVPATADTIYQSGSVGKQFTATLAMMLVEEGKIGLDDRIGKYLENAPAIWNEITVRHLLTHTSGIKNYSPQSLSYRKDYTEQELVRLAAASSLDFAPGEKWSYSNTGYVLLGVIIHRATGHFYGDLLQDRIFKPLGMETARIINEADIIPHRAAGYRLEKGALKNQEWVSPSLNTTADGSLYLTVKDLAKWDAALYGERLLKKSSLAQMWTPVRLNDGKTAPYGFGWFLGEVNGHKEIQHGGIWQGFTAHIARYVDDKLTVIVLTNLGAADLPPLTRGVAGLFDPALAPPAPKPVKDGKPVATVLPRAVLAKMIAGRVNDGPVASRLGEPLDEAGMFG
jgi:D-alanyl-D-alanine carboxypeptidase